MSVYLTATESGLKILEKHRMHTLSYIKVIRNWKNYFTQILYEYETYSNLANRKYEETELVDDYQPNHLNNKYSFRLKKQSTYYFIQEMGRRL